jgi:hypothetical protein
MGPATAKVCDTNPPRPYNNPKETTMHQIRLLTGAALIAALSISTATAEDKHLGYEDTPIIPGTNWHVHDGLRPQPKVVTPGTNSTADTVGKPPSDAVVLFDGTDNSHWEKPWKVENGYMIAGGGDNPSKEVFGDIQLHVEWSEPNPPKGDGQGRGNSGVFMMGRYELQVLDCFNNQTYPDGQTGSIYGQTPPLVNACRPPGEWQSYDIFWTAPRFDGDKLESPAWITVLHNGVLVQNHTKVTGTTPHKAIGTYTAHGDGPVKLQDHGNPVRFRSVWVRPLKPIDQP